jgi:DNA repair exonuclease SbcCD nuclease subunit
MSIILTSDTHFTDNLKDEYRWDLFPWLVDQVEEKGVNQVCILGDICDSKDKHSAQLVNRLIDSLRNLAEYCDVFILQGNHDVVTENCPFFKFIETFETNVTFIYKITDYTLTNGKFSQHCLFLPSTKDWKNSWKDIDVNRYNLIFSHATYDGAKSETGITLDGIPPSVFSSFKGKVYSGDIHVPQRIGKNIEYVGSPYRIRFGDTFSPRVILLDEHGRANNLYFPCISKHTVVVTSLDDLAQEADRLKIKAKDQVKVRVKLPRSRFPDWDTIKGQIKEVAVERQWELFGPELHQLEDGSIRRLEAPSYKSSEDTVRAYGKAKKLSEYQISLGISILNSL